MINRIPDDLDVSTFSVLRDAIDDPAKVCYLQKIGASSLLLTMQLIRDQEKLLGRPVTDYEGACLVLQSICPSSN